MTEQQMNDLFPDLYGEEDPLEGLTIIDNA